jgi:phage-related protein
MKKDVDIDERAQKELNNLDKDVQYDFVALLGILRDKGRLEFPDAKKIAKNLFEMRVRKNGVFRGLYAYVEEESIVVLHFFQKKSQKTPLVVIKIAKQRLQYYI